MDEYVKMAREFLERSNATMEIELQGGDYNPNWLPRQFRNKYRFLIKTPQGKMTETFWDSVYNTQNKIVPTEYCILSCLEKHKADSFEEFCAEFGYDIESKENERRVKRIYNGCIKEYRDLCRIFTLKQIEELREIR